MNMKTKAVTFNIELKMIEKIRKEAYDKQTFLSTVINNALNEHFNNQEKNGTYEKE